MTTPGPRPIIESVARTIQLLKLLATDFRPRRLADIVALTRAAGHTWSKTAIYSMLCTLESETWLHINPDGLYQIAPEFTAIAVAWQNDLNRRHNTLKSEIQSVLSLSSTQSTSPQEPLND